MSDVSPHITNSGAAVESTLSPLLADIERRIDVLLVKGRTREALDEAKAWLKHHPGKQAELLVVRCYRARAREFHASGHEREAQQIIDLVATRFPQHAHLVPSLASLKKEISGGAVDQPTSSVLIPPSISATEGKNVKSKTPNAPLPNSQAEIDRRVDQLIAQGQVRDALETAKGWLKSHRDGVAELLVVRCYQARAQELFKCGQVADAQQLITHASAKFPQHAGMLGFKFFQKDANLAARSNGDEIQALLADVGKSGITIERRRELALELSTLLKDPRDLMECSSLSADDPWKQEAKIVWRAFEAVCSRADVERDLEGLESISRRSPLAPWKVLVRAIHAWHQGRLADVERNLALLSPLFVMGVGETPIPLATMDSRISGDTPASALVPLLRALMGTAPGDWRSSPDQNLALLEISGGLWGMKHALQKAEKEFSKGRLNEGYNAAAAHLRLLRRYRPDLACELQVGLGRCAMQNEKNEFDHILREQAAQIHSANTYAERAALAQAAALSAEKIDPPRAFGMWEQFLTCKSALPREERLSPSEIRLVRCRMADLLPPLDEDKEDMLFKMRQMLGSGSSGSGYFHGGRKEQLRLALAAEPTPEIYKALHACLARSDPKAAETLAGQWHTACPRELEPVLVLMRAAEARNAHQKALDYLSEAEQINALDAEVRTARVRLEYVQARKHFQTHQVKLVAQDIERLRTYVTGPQLALIHALKFILKYMPSQALPFSPHENGDNKIELQLILNDLRNAHQQPLYGLLVALNVAVDFGVCSLKNQGEMNSLFRLLDLPAVSDASGLDAVLENENILRQIGVPFAFDQGMMRQCETQVAGGSGISAMQLVRVCHTWHQASWPRIVYLASGRGLSLGGQFSHIFFYYRGATLELASGSHTRRAKQCHLAALTLARRRRDMDIIGKATEALQKFDDGASGWGPFAVEMRAEISDLSEADLAGLLEKESGPPKRARDGKLKLPTWKALDRLAPGKPLKKKQLNGINENIIEEMIRALDQSF